MAKVRAIPSFARQAALEICAWSLGCIDVMALQQFARYRTAETPCARSGGGGGGGGGGNEICHILIAQFGYNLLRLCPL